VAHEVQKMAYVGQVPWHGLGSKLTPGADLETWQQEAGLDWQANLATVKYERATISLADGSPVFTPAEKKDSRVVYRSDTGDALSVVSERYKPVQPRDVIEFYRDLTERHGFVLETAGALKGGRKIWALANTPMASTLRGGDALKAYLLLATSFDGSMATQARFTSIRVVCNNTLTMAAGEGKADVTVPHSTTFDASKVKMDLGVGDAWAKFTEHSTEMSKRPMTMEDTAKFFMSVYLGLDSKEQIEEHSNDERRAKATEKFMSRMVQALHASPGAHMESARGMLWGVLNAVTYDVDHAMPAHSQANRLDAAWFGRGEVIKQKAWAKAMALVS